MLRQADKQLKARWAERFGALPEPARRALREALLELREDALARAQVQWARHKAPMALYWKVVGVYAGHLARAMRAPTRPGVPGRRPAHRRTAPPETPREPPRALTPAQHEFRDLSAP